MTPSVVPYAFEIVITDGNIEKGASNDTYRTYQKRSVVRMMLVAVTAALPLAVNWRLRIDRYRKNRIPIVNRLY